MIFDYIDSLGLRFVSAPLAFFGAAVVTFIIALLLTAMIPVFVGWADRKFAARIQSRYGPVYVGPFGLLQNFADIVKLLGKRFVSTNVDWLSFNFVPIALASASFMMVLLIPWGGASLSLISVPYDLLFIYVALAVSPLLVLLAGWGENNKYSIIGGFRGAAQIATYEIAIIISIISVALLSGGYSLSGIVSSQSSLWYIFYLPVVFVVFFLAGLATIEREPFDMPEASQELQAGWKVEYSGIKYGLFLISDYVRLVIVAMLIVMLFFGGWLGLSFLPGIAWFWIKTVIVMVFLMVPRWVFARPRIDQFIRFGWNWLLPVAILNLIVAGLVVI